MTEESESAPEAVSLAELRESSVDARPVAFVGAVSDPGVPMPELESVFREALHDGALDPEAAAATLVETLEGDQYEKHAGVAQLLGILSTAEPNALAPFVDRIVSLIEGDHLAADELAASLPPIAGTDPESVLPHADRVATLLESDLPTARHAAVATFAALTTSRAERIARLAPDLVAVLVRDQPDLGGSIAGVAESRPRTPDTLAQTLTETRKRVNEIREGAALATYDIAADCSGAIAPHVDDLCEALETAISGRVRALIFATLTEVASDRPDAVLDVRATAVTELSGSGDEVTRAAARLLSVLTDADERAVADSLREDDAISELADAVSSSDEKSRIVAASLFVTLARHEPAACAAAKETLEKAAETDENETVRSHAGEALDHLLQ
jgi:hypothetical protein